MLYFRKQADANLESLLQNPTVLRALSGGALGAGGAGLGSMLYNTGRDEEDKTNTLRNALLGGGVGAGIGALTQQPSGEHTVPEPPYDRNYSADERALPYDDRWMPKLNLKDRILESMLGESDSKYDQLLPTTPQELRENLGIFTQAPNSK